jgi:hypothetical protein
MTMSTTDQLYKIFLQHLNDHSNENQSETELIQKVAMTFLEVTLTKKWIPHFAFQDVVDDLQVEILEMYRKKTYGHLTLKDYRLRKRARKRGPQEL